MNPQLIKGVPPHLHPKRTAKHTQRPPVLRMRMRTAVEHVAQQPRSAAPCKHKRTVERTGPMRDSQLLWGSFPSDQHVEAKFEAVHCPLEPGPKMFMTVNPARKHHISLAKYEKIQGVIDALSQRRRNHTAHRKIGSAAACLPFLQLLNFPGQQSKKIYPEPTRGH